MKIKLFLVLFLFFSVLLVPSVFGDINPGLQSKESLTGQPLKHIGFVLQVDDKAEWEGLLSGLAGQANSAVEKILASASADDLKSAKKDLSELSFEVAEQEDGFKRKPAKVYVITYTTGQFTVSYDKDKRTFKSKKEDREQHLETLRLYLYVDLGIDKYEKYLK